ncbi:ubiquinol-cytochrome-c reductase cytochrome c1 [Colletotrichum cuscutae]|uniref:Ubiquinol-cytochrome-c reductase cytochrome c1 n=1 Tax=Colletotrichum cuscutae TaxID=1209917 RepID=A0AAI9YAM2_9PEZI|nr:ubiquinol-cytochrome-c reductase cytochrome c1 [Colletotrichum cuscutae]
MLDRSPSLDTVGTTKWKSMYTNPTIHIHFINKLLALQNQTSHPQHPPEIRQETSQPPSMASTMEEEIYLAMQHVFFKEHAEIRRSKAIQRRIHSCLSPAINALDLKYTRPVVVSTCQELLEKGVFKSRWKAEQRFPQLIQQPPPSPQVATPANAPETPKATRQEKDWKEEIVALIAEKKAERISQLQAAIVGPAREVEENTAIPESYTSQAAADVGDAASTTTSSDTAIAESTATEIARQPLIETIAFPVLSTAFLSYEAQHALFAKIQSLLEKACFDYAKQTHPKILEAGQWESPECVELQKWMWIFKNEVFDTFRAETVPLPHIDWHAFFESIKQIRHKAVHREVLCVANVKAYLADAESLAKLLRQDECLAKLGFLREETEMVLAVSERKKDGLAVKYQAKFDEIGVRRKELDELERRTREEMVREHRRMQSDLVFGFKLAVSEMKETEVPGKGGEVGGDEEEGAGSRGLAAGLWKLISGW